MSILVSLKEIIKTHISQAHSQSCLCSRSGVGHKNLHFQQVFRWCWCCWPGDHSLRTTELQSSIEQLAPATDRQCCQLRFLQVEKNHYVQVGDLVHKLSPSLQGCMGKPSLIPSHWVWNLSIFSVYPLGPNNYKLKVRAWHMLERNLISLRNSSGVCGKMNVR